MSGRWPAGRTVTDPAWPETVGAPDERSGRRVRPVARSWVLPLAGGWLSQLLALVMLFVAGMAIHDLRPAGLAAGPAATAWLPLVMVTAGLTGALLSATRLRPGWVDLLAALVGTGVGLVMAAGVVSGAPDLAERLRALEVSVSGALMDLLVDRVPSPELSPFLLSLSALAWTTGAYAAISVGRYARPSGAIVPIGLMLLVPVILAEVREEDGGHLLWLAIGAVAALLLVLRLNLEHQRVRWLRRQVSGGRSVGRSFLAGGATLVTLVTLGAVGLTATMGSTPLAAGWERLGSVLGDLGVEVGQLRGSPADLEGGFPDSMPLEDRWEPRDVTYFTVSTLGGGTYWRGATYDRFDGRRWHRSDAFGVDVAAGEDVLGATADVPETAVDGFREVTATFTLQDLGGEDLVAPQNPQEVDRATRVSTMGDEGPFQLLGSRDELRPGDHYTVMAWEPDLSTEGLTERTLAALADEPAPDWIGAYLALPDQGVGRLTRRIAEDIRDGLPRRARGDRYRLAQEVQRYLTSRTFRYSVDLAGVCRPGQTVSDCLLEARVGFCQQYATSMVMLLRALEVPARYVVGYLPGEEDLSGEFVVTGSAAHAWVEVWFDGFGWVRFDPTPGTSPQAAALAENGQRPTDLPEGDPIPDETLDPGETLDPNETFGPDETLDPGETEAPTPEPSASPAPGTAAPGGTGLSVPPGGVLAGAAAVLALVVGLGALLWFRRLPGGGAQRAWQGITGIATRFGRGPAPSQTPYEYSVSLSRVVPRVADDIRAIADAKVAASYAPHDREPASPTALKRAYARARTGLLALVFRRG